MAVCAKAVQQPDGSLLLALDPAVTDTATCAYVVETGASNAWTELGNLSIENASEISMAIALVWSVAWGIRAIISLLSTTEGASNE